MKLTDYLVLGVSVLTGPLLFYFRRCQLDTVLFLILLAVVFVSYFLLSRPAKEESPPAVHELPPLNLPSGSSDEETPGQM